MFTCTKTITTETAHRVMSHDGKCALLHGHSYSISVTAAADALPDSGMLVDFGVLAAHLRALVHDTIDHATVLHTDDPLVPILRDAGQRIVAVPFHPTAEHLARWVAERVAGPLSAYRARIVRVTVRETATGEASWATAD